MVLQYLRLGSDSTDYLIREVPLEPIVRQAARKYAQLFIRGKVSLNLRPMELKVLTDEKWLGFVVEQVLSNAVKYAPGGAVTVFAEGETLVIRDNGMGIARRTCPGYLRTATPAATAARTSAPRASGSTCAGKSAGAWAIGSPLPPGWGRGQRCALRWGGGRWR